MDVAGIHFSFEFDDRNAVFVTAAEQDQVIFAALLFIRRMRPCRPSAEHIGYRRLAVFDITKNDVGILHPLVLKNFDILYPCSVMELDLEELM